MSQTYITFNGVEPTTVSRVAVATGTAIKTLQQVATPSTAEIWPFEWGISFDGSAAATPGIIELIETDVAATSGTSVTPTKYGNPQGPLSLCVGGTGSTNHSPSAEGTITLVRTGSAWHIAPTNAQVLQLPLAREFRVAISKFLRIRVKFAASINAISYIIWEE